MKRLQLAFDVALFTAAVLTGSFVLASVIKAVIRSWGY
jgi:hypothetical protein